MKIITVIEPKKTIREVKVGNNVKIYDFVNLYECEIGDETRVGTFVEIQRGVKVGKRVKIQSHTFICEGVIIEDEAFIGHQVVFINDKYPCSMTRFEELKKKKDWVLQKTVIEKGASIGSNATILGGITIGEYALVGAGSVVTKNVPAYTIVAGNPAKVLRKIKMV